MSSVRSGCSVGNFATASCWRTQRRAMRGGGSQRCGAGAPCLRRVEERWSGAQGGRNPLSYGFLSPARSRRATPFPGAARRGKEREPSARARGGQFIGGIRAHTFSFGRRAAQLSTSVGSEKKFCLNCSSIACVSSTLMAAALDPARRCAQGFPGNKRAQSFKASGE